VLGVFDCSYCVQSVSTIRAILYSVFEEFAVTMLLKAVAGATPSCIRRRPLHLLRLSGCRVGQAPLLLGVPVSMSRGLATRSSTIESDARPLVVPIELVSDTL